MGLFDGFFGPQKTESRIGKNSPPWVDLTSLDFLEVIDERSLSRPQFIFKHSTTCGISRMVLNKFNENYTFSKEQADIYLIDLHAYREVSNAVGRKYGIIHESPQLLVIKNGSAIANASHSEINQLELHSLL